MKTERASEMVQAIRRRAIATGVMTKADNPIGVMAGKQAYHAKAKVKQAAGQPLGSTTSCSRSTAAVEA